MTIENKLKNALSGLIYVSESDSTLTHRKEEARYVDFNQFFTAKTRIYQGMDAESLGQAEKWRQLQKLLESNLYYLRIIKKGSINITIEISGVDKEGYLHIITATGVET